MESGIYQVQIGEYSSGENYSQYDVIESGSSYHYYVSRTDDNSGNILTDTGSWLEFQDTSGWNFEDVWTPTYSSSIDTTPLLVELKFGDGYSQISEKGLTYSRPEFGCVFQGIDTRETKSLLAFFEFKGGVDPFFFTSPNGFEKRKYVCTSWKHEFKSFNINDINARFVGDEE